MIFTSLACTQYSGIGMRHCTKRQHDAVRAGQHGLGEVHRHMMRPHLAGGYSVLNMCCCWVQAALSSWGADFLKKNKESVAEANTAVAAAIEKQKGATTGRLTWPTASFPSRNVLPKVIKHVNRVAFCYQDLLLATICA